MWFCTIPDSGTHLVPVPSLQPAYLPPVNKRASRLQQLKVVLVKQRLRNVSWNSLLIGFFWRNLTTWGKQPPNNEFQTVYLSKLARCKNIKTRSSFFLCVYSKKVCSYINPFSVLKFQTNGNLGMNRKSWCFQTQTILLKTLLFFSRQCISVPCLRKCTP